MLQRKQTLFLLLAAICGALTFLFPVETFTRGDQTYFFRTTGLFMADGTAVVDAALKVPFFIVIGFLAAVLVVAIFLYRNRQRQITVVRAMSLLLVAVAVFLFITGNSVKAYLEQGGRVEEHFGVSAILPLVMVVLVFLAERGIRKDEALVRSADRLR
jgi:formate hydrogenlyase subunit 3/multisubunit Na+/H+ antiporter MnhD subunit